MSGMQVRNAYLHHTIMDYYATMTLSYRSFLPRSLFLTLFYIYNMFLYVKFAHNNYI